MEDYDAAIDWLLSSANPSIRYLSLIDLAGQDEDSREVANCRRLIARGRMVRLLLSGQQKDGGFSVHPYRKWSGSHWRLVSLVNLAVPRDNRVMHRAAELELQWLYGAGKRRFSTNQHGYIRMHASVYGNALGSLSYLGLAGDPRTKHILNLILDAQWPDGGWNCDSRPGAHHSSFHESLATLWGLIMHSRAARNERVDKAIDKACELFLSHGIYRSHKSGRIIDGEWLKLRYPSYWHYNYLEAMRVISLAGKAGDPRMSEALDMLESARCKDGCWHAQGCYWRPAKSHAPPGSAAGACIEVVDWGREGPNEMITLNALRVLRAAGRAVFRSPRLFDVSPSTST